MTVLPDSVLVVDTGAGHRPAATLDLLADLLESMDVAVTRLAIPTKGLPRRPGRSMKRALKSFTATPEPLIESWRVASHLEAVTSPGDAVLLSDHDGAAGVFALAQSTLPSDRRRMVLVAAADSATLEYLDVAGTVDGLPEPLQSTVDWEIVAYRAAAAVLATSRRAATLVSRLGAHAEVWVRPQPPAPTTAAGGMRVLVPDPVSRLSRTPAVLRALSGMLDRPTLEVVVSAQDRPDRIWSGSTWQALGEMKKLFDDRLTRGTHDAPDVVVLGDPFAVPEPEVAALRRSGVPVVVPRDGTADVLWPDAPKWSDENELAALLVAGAPPPAEPDPPVQLPPRPVTRDEDPDRARRVSVAIPIFRRVTYLDETMASILAQDQLAHEIILVDDGSNSPEVDAAIERWVRVGDGVIRSLRLPANRGVCVARNRAIEDMTGDAFVLVDSDDVLQPSFIRRTAEALRADPGLWAAATWTEFFGAYEGVEAKPPFDRRVGLRENPIVSTCVLVDMAVRERGLRFSPDLAFLYCEDWDLWAQIVAAGGRIGLVPEPLARHRAHTSSGGYQRTPLAAALGRARATARLRS